MFSKRQDSFGASLCRRNALAVLTWAMLGYGATGNPLLQAADGLVRTPIYHTFPSQHCYVAVTSDGAAAIHLSTAEQRANETGNGLVSVKYRWRYLEKGETKETTGSGKLFAKLVDGNTTRGQLKIKAGPINLVWGFEGESRGTLAYNPEQVWLHPVNADRFEESDENREGPVPLTPFLSLDPKEHLPDLAADNFDPKTRVSAPIPYENCVLVVSTDKGTAAFRIKGDYKEQISDTISHRGVKYEWRYSPAANLREQWEGPLKGTGAVYEKYTENVYNDGELHFRAGDVALNWSMGGSECGWIYYDVRNVRVWTVETDDLDALIASIKTPSQRTPRESVER